MSPRKYNPLLGLLLLLALLIPSNALADIAPPGQPPGANLLPDAESTQVRMLAESVLIDVLGNTPPGSLGQAQVTARFTMQNLGDSDEKLAVRFPLTFLSGGDDGYGRYPEIKNFSARVNGYQVPVRRVNAQGLGKSETSVPWAEFSVTFPAGEEVPVEVSYLTEGAGEYPFISFKYILETGAGWQGTIGQADLTLRLPYEANNQNLIFAEQIGWSQTTPGGALAEREVQWKFTDLEPGPADNLEVSLVMPSAWKKVLHERDNVARNPDDGEAWGRLGKLYKEIISYRRGLRQDPGGKELYPLSVEAYEKALALLPRDALWHAGFADLLYRHYYWGESFSQDPDHGEMLRALDELRLSLALDPDNAKAIELLDEMKYALPEAVRQEGDQYLLLWLTATPTSRPSATAAQLPSPEMVMPTPTPGGPPTPTATPAALQASETSPPTILPSPTTNPPTAETIPITETPVGATEPGRGGVTVCGIQTGLSAALGVAGWLSIKKHSKREADGKDEKQ
jgi:hypothetical protein